MRLGSRGIGFAFVVPSLVCLAGVIGYPLIEAIATSLYRWNLISGSQRWAGLKNYIDILQDPDTGRVVVITLVYTVLAVGIEFLAGYSLALIFRAGLARKLRGFSMLRVIFCAPLFIAPLIWRFISAASIAPKAAR